MKITPPVMEYKQDTHCSYCGAKFLEQIAWPRKCFICWNESYKNPIPIVVSMIPVDDGHKTGLLIQQRNIDPGKGGWAMPSGYINHGETWQEAAVRENEEEMNFSSKVDDYKLWDIKRPTSGNMLIFCHYRKVIVDRVNDLITNFVANSEVQALGIYSEKDIPKLTFPTHEEGANIFLTQINPNPPWNY